MYQLPHESKFHTYIVQGLNASNKAAEISRFMLTYLGRPIGKKDHSILQKLRRGSSPSQRIHSPEYTSTK